MQDDKTCPIRPPLAGRRAIGEHALSDELEGPRTIVDEGAEARAFEWHLSESSRRELEDWRPPPNAEPNAPRGPFVKFIKALKGAL